MVTSGPIVRLGKVVPGAPHITLGQIPGAETDRTVHIGGVVFEVPLLDLDHVRYIRSLRLPSSEMNAIDNMDAKVKIVHAILSPFYPEVTIEFLEDNLTLPDADKLWSLVFPGG